MKRRVPGILLILLAITFVIYSLRTIKSAPSDSSNSIKDINKRNENWCWYVAEGKSTGEWRMTGGKDAPPDGKYTFFYCNGNLAQRQSLRDGNKYDTTFTYDLKGTLKEYTTYRNDETFNYYLNDGPYIDYNLDCTVYLTGTVKNHMRVGEWVWYRAKNNKDYSENYLDSLTHIRIDYYDSGQMKDSGRLVDHKQDGIVKYWYEHGKLEQACFWSNDLQDGIATLYYENGKLKSKTNWKQGKRNGESISYDEDGKIHEKTKYIEGQKVSSGL